MNRSRSSARRQARAAFGYLATVTALAVLLGASRAVGSPDRNLPSARFAATSRHRPKPSVQLGRRFAASDSTEVIRTLERWRAALQTGDSTAALALLAPDAIVLESGDVETHDEYRARHLAADIEFVRATRNVHSPTRVVGEGDVAWATSTSTTQGQFRGRKIDSAGAELMVLTRSSAGWRIRAIHWSSHSHRS
jgi:ketosteroid isomerase-like protein